MKFICCWSCNLKNQCIRFSCEFLLYFISDFKMNIKDPFHLPNEIVDRMFSHYQIKSVMHDIFIDFFFLLCHYSAFLFVWNLNKKCVDFNLNTKHLYAYLFLNFFWNMNFFHFIFRFWIKEQKLCCFIVKHFRFFGMW